MRAPNLIYLDFYLPPSQITPILWVGNYTNGAELALANPLDIRAVLNVSTEEPYAKHANIVYKEVPFPDGYAYPEAAFREAINFLMQQYEIGAKTLVHCAAGISRSASTVAAFMHITGQLPFDAAIQHVKKCRPIVMPHPNIYTSLKKLLKVWPYDGSMR